MVDRYVDKEKMQKINKMIPSIKSNVRKLK